MASLEDNKDFLKPYSQWSPTPCDTKGLDLEDRQDWLVGPCLRTRDSGLVEESNFRALVRALEALDPDGQDHETHRFGHWGPGWFEIVLVRPESKCFWEALEIGLALTDYPLVSEDLYSEMQCEEIYRQWEESSLRERVRLCSASGAHIMAARRTDSIPEKVFDYLSERVY